MIPDKIPHMIHGKWTIVESQPISRMPRHHHQEVAD